jgi:5-formyltetrahydrofolate cyclo-ligase
MQLSDIPSEKSVLRERGLERRRALSPEEWEARSKRVVSQLETLERFRSAPLVLTYAASKDNEVDTQPLIEALTGAGRRVAVPSVAPGRTMIWRAIAGLADLCPGRFGILEPAERCPLVDANRADTVVLVPGILFSARGQRIGYGGGYFDRFLAGFPGTSIGLAFDFQICRSLPEESHDVRLDFVVCESAVHENRLSRD